MFTDEMIENLTERAKQACPDHIHRIEILRRKAKFDEDYLAFRTLQFLANGQPEGPTRFGWGMY